ncbi:MAG: cytochrome oxidase putative small subunit CydP [Rhodanobacter sp.]
MSSLVAPRTLPENIGTPQRSLRRLTLELFVIIVLKVTVLMVIWWVAFAPHPKPDASPAAIARQLAPAQQTPPAGHP